MLIWCAPSTSASSFSCIGHHLVRRAIPADRQKSLKDYFLGGRNAPWWAIGFSIVSAETSTLTVIGTPALSFNGNFGFLQVVFGYLLARMVISVLFLPALFPRGDVHRLRTDARALRRADPQADGRDFPALRALAEGVRVFAISIVISIVLGTGEIGLDRR